MNLFQSEEHVRNWNLLNPDSVQGIMTLADWITMFSVESMKHMLDGDYLSRWQPQRGPERNAVLDQLGKTGPFWRGGD